MKRQFLVTIDGDEPETKIFVEHILVELNRKEVAYEVCCAELEPDRSDEFNRIMADLELEAELANAEPIF